MKTTTQDTAENRCEACFGMGTITLMKTPRFGYPIDHSKPICSVCKGTGKKPETR
jgi:DnaJ-class molecular chaperone